MPGYSSQQTVVRRLLLNLTALSCWFVLSGTLQAEPYELAHILFREYVGFDNPEVPRWLDKGVAQYAEIGKRQEALAIMQQGVW